MGYLMPNAFLQKNSSDTIQLPFEEITYIYIYIYIYRNIHIKYIHLNILYIYIYISFYLMVYQPSWVI